ncbi:MAG: hypothetical protein CHACPFDD_02867 [Phycisphaerae bacterium]|nr:hypothetical protein [Phycisphaerae bacterium]
MVALNVSRSRLVEICRQHRVQELAIFGSAARGTSRPDSDVDVLVEFEPAARIGYVAFARLGHDLEALFGRAVDVVSKRGLNPAIRDQVLAEAEVLFAA